MDQHPAEPPGQDGPSRQEPAPHGEQRSPEPGSRRPSPALVALVLAGIVLALSIGAYALVTAWLG